MSAVNLEKFDAIPIQPPGGSLGTFTAVDGTRLRYGAWRLPEADNRGTVVLLHGRTEFIEKHFETIADLLRRGLSVFTFDWRGQGLSHAVADKVVQGHVGDYRHYVEDLKLFMDTRVRAQTSGPLFLLAHSLGGNVALRYFHDHPGAVDRAVLCAPLVRLVPGRVPGVAVRMAARLIAATGLSTRYVPGHAAYWATRNNFDGNPLTSDPGRYRIAAEWIKREPALAVGPPTIGWLGAMFNSISVLHRPGYAAAIRTPILMIAGGRDGVVSAGAARAYGAHLKDGDFLLLPEASHEILHERDEIRDVFWAAFDRFIGLETL
jgi:lysophospholipase